MVRPGYPPPVLRSGTPPPEVAALARALSGELEPETQVAALRDAEQASLETIERAFQIRV
jgi:hypothetical protein